jgi:YHS domain-containing protein
MPRLLDSPLHAVPTRLLLALAVLLLGVMLAAPTVLAEEGAVYAKDGVALDGTDPVAYFTEGRPVAGSPDFAAEFAGTTWHFASAAHRDLFLADPGKYTPQYGGFCAYAVAVAAQKVPTDPEAWSLVEGKLYLNYSLPTRARWEEDVPGHIADADAAWPRIE